MISQIKLKALLMLEKNGKIKEGQIKNNSYKQAFKEAKDKEKADRKQQIVNK